MSTNAREAILAEARRTAQAHGYNGLNFRDLAAGIGIRSASLYYHFPSKADLGAAVARRYWEDSTAELEAISAATPDPGQRLRRYTDTFRRSLANDNRMCLCSFMAAEYDDLPDPVKREVRSFADVNVGWLGDVLSATGMARKESERRARAIYAAVVGAQLVARGRSEVAVFDALIDGYRAAGLLPA